MEIVNPLKTELVLKVFLCLMLYQLIMRDIATIIFHVLWNCWRVYLMLDNKIPDKVSDYMVQEHSVSDSSV